MNLSSLFHLFNNLRYSAGIAMMFNGFPIVFFIRDTLHIGPASNVFTAFFFALALILMTPTHLFIRLYKPNVVLLKYAVLFLALALYHFFIFNNTGFDWFVELGNFGFTFAFLFMLIHVPNHVKDTLVPILFIFAFFSNLTLIYSLLTDPNWKLGMRAAVTFENAGAQEGGNPHIAARNGLVCLLTAFVLMWTYKNVLIRLFLICSILISIGVLVLAQVKSSLLALGLIAGFFLVFNVTLVKTIQAAKALFSLRNILVVVVMVVLLNFLLNRFSDFYSVLVGYWAGFENKIMDIVFTAFGLKISETASVDASAMGRVTSFIYFQKAFLSPEILFVGRGYKDYFMDVPLVEAIINHGIFGFIFFGGFNLYLLIYTIREIRNPTNPLTLFLAYFFVYFTILLISNGRPYDVSFWFPYAVMIRFLGIHYLDASNKPLENQELVTSSS
ncbi:hypothetical protein [Arundinibacter roseus]|uniref:O-antigen ligase domain-containing protein n=1 Tax=Arundinibacter roseus TaxID=2070510 RepID=A0A4R4KCG8_9BACT|nr:hypothetical protein [Arundinibacter roseus]TDB64492.1 hypothetical protein EZE20_12505 [Arundinibacter roseus]